MEIYPDFRICRSKDLMVRGRSFYAIWDEEKGLWSTDEYDVQRLVDKELKDFAKKTRKTTDDMVTVRYLSDFSSRAWSDFRNYISHISDNSNPLDNTIVFANAEVKKSDYASKKLDYPLKEGSYDAYDELVSTLYDPEERHKLEWAIGSIVSGDSKTIQKFLVLFGQAGAGKSTILNIIQKLFSKYYSVFEAKALTSNSSAFATEAFKHNPLVAIQHDGDLSKIEDNTILNSIVSHEEIVINEKYKPSYKSRTNSFLFMGTNKPVKITDSKSGLIRRLIDVKPSGRRIPPRHYQSLMTQIEFELGAIAYYCLQVYREAGKNYYSNYKPLDMMFHTDIFFNFVESNYHAFKEDNGITLSRAYELYKVYCDETLIDFKMPRHKFREELKSYFETFSDVARVNGAQIRSYYSGFLFDKLSSKDTPKEEHQSNLVLEHEESLLDIELANFKAQYAHSKGAPLFKWEEVKTKLKDLDTKKLHYVSIGGNHIIIDFDLTDEKGKKSLELNMQAASKWPATYTEYSKSGKGIHLHYLYEGDVQQLSRVYSEGIEVKVFNGNSSLRRKLTKCNNIPIATINSGLPLKGEKKMINIETVKSENGIRELIKKNLNKEIHPGTKPSIDFIYKILDDAYTSELVYDVTDMRPHILAFANNSTNQSEYCVKLVCDMKFKSEKESENIEDYETDDLVFFDVEVFPNLLVVCWKMEGKEVVRMINPSPSEIEKLLRFKLIGFNNRRYDNHILYARYLGYDNEQIYKLSQKIIGGSKNAMFMEAYNLSYTDIYCFSSKKQSLKKFEIELGIHHMELGLPWDQPVPKCKWLEVAEYCDNDVIATEETFKSRKEDYNARLILAKLSGLTANDTTQKHTAKIIFGNDKKPQDKFVYTDLSEMFPGYKYEFGKSTYRGEDVGEGGYVYGEPGMYSDVALLDVKSEHPTSLIQLNHFGPYTKVFAELVESRLAIKEKRYEDARKLLNGMLAEFLEDETNIGDLAYSLKIVINIVYGMTSAKFDNPFKDPRNKDNIVAKRGALFMIDLKYAIQEKGFTVAHVKTDSVKIPNATPEIIEFVHEFGKKYGYEFEHEATYEKLCLVNESVYIAKNQKGWSPTGAQFAHPYVFKTLFSNEPLDFKDMCETKSVKTALYLDMNEGLGEDEHDYKFIGKVGSFCPIKPGCGGGLLLREKEDKYYAATGSKGYRWLESEMVEKLNKQNDIDDKYHKHLVDEAIAKISQFGDFEWFVGNDTAPWCLPCGRDDMKDCFECKESEFGYKNPCNLGHSIHPF